MTYLALAALVVVPAAVVAVLAGRRGGSRWWTTTALTIAVLILLTIVFDSLMIYADLFRYDEAHLAGAGTIPGIGLPMCLISAEILRDRILAEQRDRAR